MASGAAEPYGREGLPLDQARCRVLESIKARRGAASETRPLRSCLDRVCAVQVAAAGRPTVQPSAEVLEHAARQYGDCTTDGPFRHGKYEWAALLRQAERLQANQPTMR